MQMSTIYTFLVICLQSTYDYEHSELLLYQNMVIQESGALDDALKHLDHFNSQICDKLSIEETWGKFIFNYIHSIMLYYY